jgi:hypothetical protein
MTRRREFAGWTLLIALAVGGFVASYASDTDRTEAVGTAQCGPVTTAPDPEGS